MNFSALTKFLDRLPSLGVPGCDCLIYYHHQPVYRHTSGYYDIENQIKMKEDALYNLYSASKLVTCTAALQLYEQGAFLFKDPLYEYIPEFKRVRVNENGVVREAKNPILIEDLFSMRSGITHDIRIKPITEMKQATGGRCPTLKVAQALAEEPLLFEPHTHYHYGLSHDVLGALVEVLSGQTLGEYCQKNIFEPLGMTETTYLPNGDTEARLAPLYMLLPEEKKTMKISSRNVFRLGDEHESGGAGIISSVEDFIKLAECLCNYGKTPTGEKVLSRGTIELMRTNQLDDVCLQDFDWPDLVGYGYGLGVRTMIDRAQSGSPGSYGEFGWGGAAGAYVLIDPEAELAVYYAQHMLESLEPYIHPRLRNIIYTCLDA
ncbi:MAG: beta-lactamase family protein [Ruminococcaceae bacterium]|nr:beta-lactamase family protein [Oscillospiraceae bacterium]